LRLSTELTLLLQLHTVIPCPMVAGVLGIDLTILLKPPRSNSLMVFPATMDSRIASSVGLPFRTSLKKPAVRFCGLTAHTTRSAPCTSSERDWAVRTPNLLATLSIIWSFTSYTVIWSAGWTFRLMRGSRIACAIMPVPMKEILSKTAPLLPLVGDEPLSFVGREDSVGNDDETHR
jgi:hypothetical protein